MLQKTLSDLKGVQNIDYITVQGKMRKAHDEVLENCLKRLETLNLKVKREECHILGNEIKFYGLIFSVEGTKPDPGRIVNLIKLTFSKNAGIVRSFFGMANTCQGYILDRATITAPMRELTKKNTVFQ